MQIEDLEPFKLKQYRGILLILEGVEVDAD